MNLKSSLSLILLLNLFSSAVFYAQIAKQDIINEVNFINNKTNANEEDVQIFQVGHGTNERTGIDINKIQIKDEEPSVAVLTSYWFKYSDNYSKTKVYLKSNIPIFVVKEKKITLTSTDDSNMKEVLTSYTKLYIFDWVKWEFEKEIIQDGGRLLENSIDKQEIINIINESKKK
ncbi:hypothetical protein [Chryseobacterium turcicum]|uniref:DUF4468 domain-containing protein n=1 Tax=Chryseobacterium turcicum TaxID=2898076 RepID=A0A9Q3UZC4_9FLAO|nr:hypothetical protein [Chryseobacterium turcicum]MCD1116688.1 hypothetical protein [Chryseobacterium turcicum]